MNADGTGQVQLTNVSNTNHLGPQWLPDVEKIVFQRQGQVMGQGQQIWVMNLDGTGQTQLTPVSDEHGQLLTDLTNLFPNWGVVKAKCAEDDEDDEGNEDN
jgi:hypothetical protein